MEFYYPLLIVLAYLLGSVSASIMLSKYVYGIDIRTLGSTNAGANNVQRIFGWKAGMLVLVFDFLKGVAAVSLVSLTKYEHETELFVGFQILLGTAVILGHIFPLFFRFRGGKGVAALCGVLFAIHPWAVLICAGVFLIVFLLTRYISASVIAAVTAYPIFINSIFALWLQPEETFTLKIFSIIIAAIIWLTHLSNIKRLFRGREEKFALRKPVDSPFLLRGKRGKFSCYKFALKFLKNRTIFGAIFLKIYTIFALNF